MPDTLAFKDFFCIFVAVFIYYYHNTHNMKKFFILFTVVTMLLCGCNSDKPAESYIAKNSVEFAGNAFSSFSLGADVRLFTVQNPSNKSEWTLQAVVPVRKENDSPLDDLSINLVPLDEHGVRLRDGLVLQGEDLTNLIPVFNSGENVERNIVFSIADSDKKFMTASEAAQLLESTKGVRLDINATAPVVAEPTTAEPAEAPAAPDNKAAAPAQKAPQEYPMTLDGQLRRFGIYGLLAQYDKFLRDDNDNAAKRIEDQLWAIEKRVKADSSIPSWLRDQFVDYIEDKEDEIEDRY